MSTEAHKTLIARYVDELNRRNFAILDEVVAEQVVLRSLRRVERDEPPEVGRAVYREGILRRIAAFPDYHVTILEMIAEADQVVLYWRNQGTHSGMFQNILPTGRVLEEVAVSIYRIANGQIVEVRGFGDQLDYEQQLGLRPQDSKFG